MHSEITTITATESSDIQRLESQVSAHTSATSSNIGTIQTELHNLEDTLFRKLKPIGKCFSLLICYLCLKTGLLSYIVFIFIFITDITHDKSNFKTIRFRDMKIGPLKSTSIGPHFITSEYFLILAKLFLF